MSALHRIRVLGRELQVRSTASRERVRQIEEYVNCRIESLESSAACNDSLNIAILALMNIAESYLDVASEGVNRDEIKQERIFRLIQHIEDSTK